MSVWLINSIASSRLFVCSYLQQKSKTSCECVVSSQGSLMSSLQFSFEGETILMFLDLNECAAAFSSQPIYQSTCTFRTFPMRMTTEWILTKATPSPIWSTSPCQSRVCLSPPKICLLVTFWRWANRRRRRSGFRPLRPSGASRSRRVCSSKS